MALLLRQLIINTQEESMKFNQAWDRVALAGRELGSGPAVATPRLIPDYQAEWERLCARLRPKLSAELQERMQYDEVAGAQDASRRAELILLGAAIGLVMAEDRDTMKVLADINREWLEGES
jgi:hypothetical protein